MRLDPLQIKVLTEACQQCFGETAKIWLFGSRVDDSKHGGDIDLYIETDKETGLIEAKLEMRTLIWSQFGDQKMDILVRSRKDKMNPMHHIAKSEGVELPLS